MAIRRRKTFHSELSARLSSNTLSRPGSVLLGGSAKLHELTISSDLPLIVSLEVHTSPPQQQIMVEIMKEEWGAHLIDLHMKADENTPLPTLDSLRNRILIKVKYSAPGNAAKKGKKAPANPSGVGMEGGSSEDEDQAEALNKGHIIPELGSLGIYTRSYHFKDFNQPEAKVPTHIFSLSETKLLDTHKRDAPALFRHNKVSD